MIASTLWEAFERYDRELETRRYEVKQFGTEEYARKGIVPVRAMLEHCRWMCRQCLGEFKSAYEGGTPGSDEVIDAFTKCMRWLGYVQGVLHTLGVFSLEELRAHSRGAE